MARVVLFALVGARLNDVRGGLCRLIENVADSVNSQGCLCGGQVGCVWRQVGVAVKDQAGGVQDGVPCLVEIVRTVLRRIIIVARVSARGFRSNVSM